ncbi:sigma-70 family RNA polymerase sigma factor [Thioclava sp. BHET1]|nr:sigma-70 family RNA polymerase sigma factor [Thioclava sp. BHET1]
MNADPPDTPATVPEPHEVLHQTGKWIHRTAWRLHSRMPWADVEDMIQHGVLTALELREKYHPDRGVPFAIYIKPRVMGAMVDISRQAGAIRRREDRYVEEAQPPPEPGALDLLILCEDVEILAAAIDTLPDDERNAISLFYLEEMRNKDVAEIMGISEVRVVRLRERALAHLSKVIRDPSSEAPLRLETIEGNHI